MKCFMCKNNYSVNEIATHICIPTNKSVENCFICGEQASMRTVGASNVLIFCWKHDVAAKRHWGTDYHLAPKKIKEEIRDMSTDKLSKIFKVSL